MKRSAALLLALGTAIVLASAASAQRAAGQNDETAVARLLSALKASPSDESTRTALRVLVSRQPPVARDLDERIRDAFRASARVAAETLDPPGEPGEIMQVEGRVTDASGRAVAGALVYVFHADSTGWYARQGEMDERHPRLYAYMRTGADGRYSFRTARPGGYQKSYQGRLIPSHIHFDVSAAGLPQRRFQLVFDDDPRMDGYWREWARRQNHPIAAVGRRGGLAHCVVDISLM
jgi:protocatechuate 3,4-dioxygenase beta subunit